MNPLYEYSRAKYSRLSRSFGIAAIVSAVVLLSVSYISIGFACLSILFAILSKGYGASMDKLAKTGVRCSIIALIMSVSMTTFAIFRLYNDVDYRNSVISTFDSVYGDYYEEAYGVNVSDLFNEFFAGEQK